MPDVLCRELGTSKPSQRKGKRTGEKAARPHQHQRWGLANRGGSTGSAAPLANRENRHIRERGKDKGDLRKGEASADEG